MSTRSADHLPALGPQTHARLLAIAAAIGDAIVAADADGRIEMWTGAAEKIFGWTEAEMRGRPLTDLMPDRYRAAHLAGLARVAAGGREAIIGRHTVELEALHRDGTEFPVELSLARGDHSGAPFFVGVIRDVTERRIVHDRLALATERFRTAFEDAPIGMAMTAPDGRFLRVNRAFCALLGYDQDALTRLESAAVTHHDERADDAERQRALLAGETECARAEKRYLHSDGRTVWAEVSISLVRGAGDAPAHFITQVQDVTERRRAAADLERSNTELQHLASVASHDLREPLRLIQGFLDLLRTRHSASLDAEGHEFIRHASDGAHQMQELIDALMRYARVGAGEAERSPVDAGEIAREALASLTGALSDRSVHAELGPLPRLGADPVLLRQIFQNLLANAAKFARRDDPRVSVRAERRPGEWVFVITDNGPGIPPADRERVLRMFSRGTSSTGGRDRGAGLGLAICQRAVENHGGRIWIDEAPGGGACVHFAIPDARLAVAA